MPSPIYTNCGNLPDALGLCFCGKAVLQVDEGSSALGLCEFLEDFLCSL